MLEPNIYGLWAGKQTAKGAEQTTAGKRFVQVGGDLNIARDDGDERWSDGSKYGGRTRWINSLLGNGSPALEATPNELGYLLHGMHGAETFTAGTDNVWTLAGAPSSGTFDLKIWDGKQYIVAAAVANTVTAGALDTALEAAFAAAGYGANQVTVGGGPLNTTAITITFDGTGYPGTAKRPFYLYKANDTTSPAVTLTNTTPGVRAKHSFIPQSSAGFWMTWMRRIGSTTIQRANFLDCLVGGLTIEASTTAKAMRMTPQILSLDPAKVTSSDPAATLPQGSDIVPFLFNESHSRFNIDGTNIEAHSELTLTINEDRSPAYADDVVPHDLVVGQPGVTLGLTLLFDDETLAQWNQMVYGAASPAAGTKPNRYLPPNGSYGFDFRQLDGLGNLTGNKFVGAFPSVAWALPEAPPPNPAGGAQSVTLAGTVEPPGGAGNAYTLDVFNADTAAYAANP